MNRLSTHFQPWDIQLVTTMYEALARRRPKSGPGPAGAPAEMVLRLLVLKHVRIWSYATLEREVRSYLVYRAFTRIGGGPVPEAKTMGRWGVGCWCRQLGRGDPLLRAAQAPHNRTR